MVNRATHYRYWSVLMKKLPLVLSLGLALAACGQQEEAAPDAAATAEPAAQPAPAAEPAAPELSKIEQVLAGDHRGEANKARDAFRHPKETLEFFLVDGSETIVEITPGGGWYTEVLAPYTKGSGKLIAAIVDPASSSSERARDYYSASNQKFRDKLAADADNYGEVEVVEFDAAAPVFGEPESVQRVLTFRNVHNWTGGGNGQAMFDAFFAVLEPGGILGVVEHRAAADANKEDAMKAGYLAQADVVAMAEQAGFILDAESEINANPADTKDHPSGVWNLPPNLRMAEGDEDKAKYEAIGESDRMTLRFMKPSES